MSTQLTNTPLWRRLAAALSLILGALLLGGGCGGAGEDFAGNVSTAIEQAASEAGSSAQSGEGRTVTVTEVTDGDTVSISPVVMGHSQLRLVGVDAPEATSETDPIGPQATAFAERRLEGEQVQLMVAPDPVGPYDRLLGNVSRDGKLFAERLLARGLSQTLFYEPNTEHRSEFEAIQRRAREADKGIWGLSPERACELKDRGNGIGGGC